MRASTVGRADSRRNEADWATGSAGPTVAGTATDTGGAGPPTVGSAADIGAVTTAPGSTRMLLPFSLPAAARSAARR